MKEYRIQTKLMGSMFELIVGHEYQEEAQYFLDIGIEEIVRIEHLLSEFKENTVTASLNKNAGIAPVPVDEEVYALLQRCQRISALTQGAFDITVAPLKKLYRFKNQEFSFPDADQIRNTLDIIGYRYLVLDESKRSAFLSKNNMSLSFAAIGKGYAADNVRKLWIEHGLTSGVISASGDLTTIGNKMDGSPWQIGIADPDHKESMLFYIPVRDASVATSGDYEQYFMHGGVRYSHNINPLTGWPVTGIKSVSVFSPGAELSDALATAVYVMGIDTGIHFINQLPETHCLIIDDQHRVHHSKNIDIYHEKQK
jgi:FAD:protein FMN transferase